MSSFVYGECIMSGFVGLNSIFSRSWNIITWVFSHFFASGFLGVYRLSVSGPQCCHFFGKFSGNFKISIACELNPSNEHNRSLQFK